MKSGLEGRNNLSGMLSIRLTMIGVSMKSGLEGRNNGTNSTTSGRSRGGLNEVRPRRPEQFGGLVLLQVGDDGVSMKSGLEGRNNPAKACTALARRSQFVSMKSGLEGRNNRVFLSSPFTSTSSQ